MNANDTSWEALREVPLWGWILLVTLLLAQAIFMFNDARKRGLNAWAWGAFGLLNVPSSLIVYYLVAGLRDKNEPDSRKTPKEGSQ